MPIRRAKFLVDSSVEKQLAVHLGGVIRSAVGANHLDLLGNILLTPAEKPAGNLA